jgi:hypothetical protein
MRVRFLFVLVMLGALAAAPAAGAATQSASAGGVTATFTFQGTFPNYTGVHLTIQHGTVGVYDAAVTDPACGSGCGPGAPSGPSVHVLDLSHNGTRDVVLDLFSGGAHCCTIEQVFAPRADGSYAKVAAHDFGDPGDRILDLDHNGRLEFLTADDRFAYAFTDFAASGLPVQVLSFSGGRFHDITRRYPHRIARDGSRWLRIFRSMAANHFADSTGVIAAWAADEDLLGKHVAVDRYLKAQARAGHLNQALGPDLAPSGTHFIAVLHRFLRRFGYLR